MWKCISCQHSVTGFFVNWKKLSQLDPIAFYFYWKKFIEISSTFFHSNNLNLHVRDKEQEKWLHTSSMCMCASKENSLLLVVSPPAQGKELRYTQNWDRWWDHISQSMKPTGETCLSLIPSTASNYGQIQKVQVINLESRFRLRIRRKIWLWSDFIRTPSCCYVWLSAPRVLQHGTEIWTSGTKS